ncbi:MAG TPA: hypothetical protein VMH02_06305, partial [Verrucomicrobiae bacterium]|nr:hypothetical protein [Verrucomicrobiae bacterium]
TAFANVLPLRERFLANGPTARATLGRFERSGRSHEIPNTSFLRFIFEHLVKRARGGRENLAIEGRLLGDVAPWSIEISFCAPRHILDGEIFAGDQIGRADYRRRGLMEKVAALVGALSVDRHYHALGLSPILRAFLFASESLLGGFELGLHLLEEARIGDLAERAVLVRDRKKRLDAPIAPNGTVAAFALRRALHRDRGVPASSLMLDFAGRDLAKRSSLAAYGNRTNAGDSQAAVSTAVAGYESKRWSERNRGKPGFSPFLQRRKKA